MQHIKKEKSTSTTQTQLKIKKFLYNQPIILRYIFCKKESHHKFQQTSQQNAKKIKYNIKSTINQLDLDLHSQI